MKNIMIISRSLAGGGAERVATMLATYLSKYYSVSLVIIDGSENTYGSTVPTIDLKMSIKNKGNRIVWFYQLCKRIKELKREKQIDVSISFLTEPDFANVFTNSIGKTIVSIRNKKSEEIKGLLRKIRDLIIFLRTDYIVSLSKMVKEDLIKKYHVKNGKVGVIYNSCDSNWIHQCIAKQSLQIETDEVALLQFKYILNVGRLEEQKGQWHLIRAFGEVVKKYPQVKLVILGRGNLEDYLKSLVKCEGLTDNVIFLGYRSNIYWYLKNAYLFVFSSLFEGLGNVLLESIACGTPIVSSDCDSGPREILAPELNYLDTGNLKNVYMGEYGVLTPVMSGRRYGGGEPLEEQELQFSKAILSMLEDEELYGYYKAKTEERQRYFEVETIVNQWREAIDSLLL